MIIFIYLFHFTTNQASIDIQQRILEYQERQTKAFENFVSTYIANKFLQLATKIYLDLNINEEEVEEILWSVFTYNVFLHLIFLCLTFFNSHQNVISYTLYTFLWNGMCRFWPFIIYGGIHFRHFFRVFLWFLFEFVFIMPTRNGKNYACPANSGSTWWCYILVN